MSTHQLTPMTSPAQSRPTAATASSERDRILEEQLPTVGYIVPRIATRLPEHVDVEDLQRLAPALQALPRDSDGAAKG